MNTTTSNEVDFINIILKLWNSKVSISIFVISTTIASVIYAIKQPNIYEAKITYAMVESNSTNSPFGNTASLFGMSGLSSSSLDKYIPILKSNDLLIPIIEKNDLGKILFPNLVDSTTNEWLPKVLPEQIPTALTISNYLKTFVYSFETSTSAGNTLVISVKLPSPETAAMLVHEIANQFLNKIDSLETTLNRQNLNFYRDRLQNSNTVEEAKVVANLIMEETKKSLLIGKTKFQLVDQVRIPEKPISPKRKIIVIIGLFVGILLGIFNVFALELYHEVRKTTKLKIKKTNLS